ncbi:MAG: pilus assembly protein PilM [Deltaproteobacteria bacterium]|nr:pilus assembly protein PilM [Deltaproteobacteria bacterium]
MFAVDLGAWSVKLAIASPGIRGATLLNVVERLVPPGDQPAETRAKAVLASLIEELRLRDDNGYIGVFGDQVFTQVLDFGFKNLRRSELEKAVGGELEGVVPVDLEDMVYTFEAIPAPPVADPNNPSAALPDAGRGRLAAPTEGMRVLTYAMRKERAEQLIEMGKSCGFDPRGILACGGSAVRLVQHTPSLTKARTDGAVAVIDVGHDRTDVVVVADGKAVFSRSIARAGKHVTEAIAKFWKLPWQDAERAKHSDGFVASQTEPATSDQWARIHSVTVGELQPFARDLRQTLAACRARTGFAPIAALLVGGGSRLRGMSSYLSEQLGVACWRPTPDDVIVLAGPRLGATSSQLPIDSAAMTIGMAYDCAGGRPQFDLRSGSLAVKMDLSFLRAKAVPLGAAVLAIAAFAAGSAYADLYRLRKAEKVLSTRLATESADVLGESKSADDVLASTGPGGVGVVSPLPKMSAYDILLEVSNHVPPKEKITLDIDQMQIDDVKVDLQGTTKTAEGIDLLVTELKKIECFKDVARGPTDTQADGTKRFKLTITTACM